MQFELANEFHCHQSRLNSIVLCLREFSGTQKQHIMRYRLRCVRLHTIASKLVCQMIIWLVTPLMPSSHRQSNFSQNSVILFCSFQNILLLLLSVLLLHIRLVLQFEKKNQHCETTSNLNGKNFPLCSVTKLMKI